MWIIPTLNRPEQCAEVLSRMDMMGCKTPRLVVANGEHEKYRAALSVYQAVYYAPENRGALGALNWGLNNFSDEPWYGFIGDDEFMDTDAFDKKLTTAAGDWDIAHGDDGFNKGARFQGCAVIGGKLARAVGYLALQECWHWYGFDSMWESLAQAGACKKVFVPEVKVNHQHPYHGKGKMDECYELGASRKDIDQQVYFHWLRHEIKNVIERVKKAKGI